MGPGKLSLSSITDYIFKKKKKKILSPCTSYKMREGTEFGGPKTTLDCPSVAP